jgi:hypothetical protein
MCEEPSPYHQLTSRQDQMLAVLHSALTGVRSSVVEANLIRYWQHEEGCLQVDLDSTKYHGWVSGSVVA